MTGFLFSSVLLVVLLVAVPLADRAAKTRRVMRLFAPSSVNTMARYERPPRGATDQCTIGADKPHPFTNGKARDRP
jgi:hypothetical protein